MRTEVIKANSIAEATERILEELKEDPANTSRSIGSRNNVIYFDGWDGLGASTVLRAVAQRLTAMASSDEVPAGLKFDQIIHIDCSKWESRRSLQRAVAEQLELPAPVMDMFDRQAEEDDFHGILEGSRTEIPQVLRAMFQRIQERNRRFLVIFHNGSTEEIDLAIFGFLLSGYSTNKVLWTFQGKLRLKPKMKVVKAIESETTGKTDVFLSASTRHEEEDPRKLLMPFLVHQEATEVAASLVDNNTGGGRGIVDQPSQVVECFLYMLKLCCLGYHFNMVGGYDYDMATHSCNYWMCDAIIRQQERQVEATDASWQAADALRLAMPFDVDYYDLRDHSYLPPSYLLVMWGNDDHGNNSTTSQPGAPFPSPPNNSYGHLPVPASAIPNADMFQYFDNKLSVLKLCGRTFSLSSPPFINCRNLKFLWLDHCQVQDTADTTAGGEEEEEAMIRRCFQKLWVLDVRYTRCDGILSTRLLDFMTHLRELNVEGAQDWDVGQLQGRLPNIRKLRVTKSTVLCTSCSEDNLFLGMNKMELLEFSGNRTMQGGGVAANLSGISTSSNRLETMIITDGCVGIQKLSFRGCAKLKNLLLSGLFEDLCTLDLSGTAVKTIDLSAMTAQRLDEVILDNCDKLCAILWPPQGKRKSYLQKLHMDITQSASTSRSGQDIMMAAGSTAATGSSSSSWLQAVLVNGAPINWYISIKDTRLLRSFVPSFETYFNGHKGCLEISSPRCYSTVDVSDSENEGIKNETREEQQVLLSNRRQQQPQYNSNASMYYADVATVIVEEHLLQEGDGNGNDAPTITRTRPCPPPNVRLRSSDCYLYTHDQQMKTKATMDSGAIATIPSIICDNAWILHVQDSLYYTSIPGPARWHYLLWCRVERCPRMEFIFTAPKLGGKSTVPMCWFLRTFWASQLPRARFMWDMSKLPLSQINHQSFEEVTLLHLDFCPRLIHVLPFTSSVRIRRCLKTLEIVWCGDLRVVFPLLDTDTENHEEQQQQKPPSMVDFPNLKRIHLHELPMLKSICGLGRMYAPKLETIKIRGCWSLKHLPAVKSNRSNNKVECDCEKEWWDRLEWDGLDGKHHSSLYRLVHSRYYKRKLLRGSVLI